MKHENNAGVACRKVCVCVCVCVCCFWFEAVFSLLVSEPLKLLLLMI